MFLNYFDHSEVSKVLLQNYTTQSPIFIQNTESEYIIFENNSFDSNVGLYGGAILIDNNNNPNINDKEASPFVYFKKNNFTKNMAYFEGNAVYIVGG